MGYFTKNGAGPVAGPLAPLTHEAVRAVLDGWGASYAVDDDGDLGGYWDGHLFFFLRGGQEGTVLTVRGRWAREVGADQVDRVAALLNAWHDDKIWPKGYARAEGDALGVYGEVSTPLGSGVTEGQLAELMSCGLATTLQMFDHLDGHYPDAAAAAAAAAATSDDA